MLWENFKLRKDTYEDSEAAVNALLRLRAEEDCGCGAECLSAWLGKGNSSLSRAWESWMELGLGAF